MRISTHFSRDEFLTSQTAARLGYSLSMDRFTLENIERLVADVLQPAREAIGLPFVITSGYRPVWLNKMIGGAPDSRHMYGCAADFVVPTIDIQAAFEHIKELQLPDVDQLILEFPHSGRGWIHAGVAIPGMAPRNEYIIATKGVDGKTIYSPA